MKAKTKISNVSKLVLDSKSILRHIFFFFISWRLITLQYCSGFCHTLK